jgi:hypothetical protein
MKSKIKRQILNVIAYIGFLTQSVSSTYIFHISGWIYNLVFLMLLFELFITWNLISYKFPYTK